VDAIPSKQRPLAISSNNFAVSNPELDDVVREEPCRRDRPIPKSLGDPIIATGGEFLPRAPAPPHTPFDKMNLVPSIGHPLMALEMSTSLIKGHSGSIVTMSSKNGRLSLVAP
jgi:hypothetical protein